MKKLIRHKETKAFLTREGEWTGDFLKGWNVMDEQQAVLVKNALRLPKAELYYSYLGDRPCEWDFSVSLE